MRIIAGLAKGMTLRVPRGDAVRPTSDRVREAIFSSLGARVVGATVLDLFAGTGALGLEAASRGAASVAFVENARAALDCLQHNIDTFQKNRGIECAVSVVRAEAFTQLGKFSAETKSFSLLFADPPYGATAQQLLDAPNLPSLLMDDGVLVIESAKRDVLTLSLPWKISREAIYGDTRVSFLARLS